MEAISESAGSVCVDGEDFVWEGKMSDELKFDPDALRKEFADYCTEVEPGIKAKAPRLNQLETLALIGMTVFQAAKELKHEKAASIAALEAANARIAELEAAAKSIPAGWKLVPVEMNADMLAAMMAPVGSTEQRYAKMLAVAPSPVETKSVGANHD